MRRTLVFTSLFWAGCMPALAQIDTRPQEGLRSVLPRQHAITDARIWLGPGQVIESGTVLIADGRITAVGRSLSVPAGAQRWNAAGKTVYPAFVELRSDYGVDPAGACSDAPPVNAPAAAPRGRRGGPAGDNAASSPSALSPRHWNGKICSERDVAARVQLDAERAKALRQLGFGAVLAAPAEGVLRGQSALLSLKPGVENDPGAAVLAAQVAQHGALEQVSGFGGQYPGSLMGAYALTRQTLLDARWQQAARSASAERPAVNLSLSALEPLLAGRQQLFWQTSDETDVGRVQQLSSEFGLKLVLVGNGTEYRVLPRIKATGAPLVVPLNFPQAPQVDAADAGLDVSLAALEHWHDAAFNARELSRAGIRFALSSAGLEKPDEEFLPNLRKAIRYGLDQDQALLALTRTPAQLIGQTGRLGVIENGAYANLLIADADWLSASGDLYEVWVEGQREELKPLASSDLAGRWTLPGNAVLDIGTGKAPKFKLGETELKGEIKHQQLNVRLPGDALGVAGQTLVLTARLEGERLQGRWIGSDGIATPFVAARAPAAAADADGAAGDAEQKTPQAVPQQLVTRTYPGGEYGRSTLPVAPAAVLFRNATVWMTGAEQPLAATDVLVRNGRIAAVGGALEAPANAQVIDASGKHLTPGLIDAHSHIAVSGNVNEPSHSVTSEVRIGDVIDPTDIDIYRQLAGGLTAAHILHGSANTIGGQAQLIKLRWGADAEGLKFAGVTPTIKFALGENPKQANWGDNFRSRYPQTRMGVEQLLRDSFNAAREYAAAKAQAGRTKTPFRTDLRLEALAEILAGQRLVHIHSYRADEILMFARLAQDYGIPTAVFQHVLEGYKVAPELAAGGFSTSSFSDWWGYKMEVYDGIPHNNALLTHAKVVASTNSDSNDLARRMNTEAAKAIRYGGLSPVQALALVTVNPARQLRIDDRVGSIKAGLDADLVLWNASPLSAFARVEQTWVDGALYFDVAADAAEQQRIGRERSRLIELARSQSSDRKEGKPLPGQRPPGQLFALDLRRGLPAELRALRPIYHDGEPVHLCRAGE